MAIVGQSLPTAEAGWKRIDVPGTYFKTSGTWTTETSTDFIGGSRIVSNAAGAVLEFKFYGTKLLFLDIIHSSRSSNSKIIIDSVEYPFNTKDGTPSTTQASVTWMREGLPLQLHTVQVINAGDGYIAIEAIDIDNTAYITNAAVGQPLTAPEAGWKRIEDTDSRFQFDTVWLNNNSALNSGGNQKYVTSGTHWIKFTFYGTKFRFIGSCNTDRPTENVNTVVVDGVNKGGFSQYASGPMYSILNYEIDNLPMGIHQVQIISSGLLGFDAIDIDNTAYITNAVVGQPLTAPEAGWKRIDDSYPGLIYKGTWAVESTAGMGYYQNSEHWTATAGSSVEFQFMGSKLRLISSVYTNRDPGASIFIDGVEEHFSEDYGNTRQVLVYEKAGLTFTVHTVKIVMNQRGLDLDAIDIDDTGYVLSGLPPTTGQLRHTLREMKVGDFAQVYWDATNNKWVLGSTGGKMEGNIGGIAVGTQQDYYVFAVKVAKGLLVSDRIWYHSSSWDQLNSNRLIEGQPATLTYADDNSISIPITVRSLRGGVAYATADGKSSTTNTNSGGWPTTNEWDQYLNRFPSALIQAGKTTNDIFHHTNDGVNPVTWVQETPISTLPSYSVSARIGRRGWDFGHNLSNITTAILTGYRPVFEYKEV